VQVPEIGFLRSVHRLTLCDKVRTCQIRKRLNAASLVLILERS